MVEVEVVRDKRLISVWDVSVEFPAVWIQSNQPVLGQKFRCSGLSEPSHPRQVGFNRTYQSWVRMCVVGDGWVGATSAD